MNFRTIYGLILVVFLGVVAGCDRYLEEYIPTQRAFATLTPYDLPTLPPTATHTPTVTPLAPARIGTPAFIPEEMIRPETIEHLVEYARWGSGIPVQVSWAPSGDQFAVATTAGLYLYNSDLEFLQVLAPGNAFRSLAYSPDGSILAGGNEDGVIFTWDPLTGIILQEIKGPPAIVLALVFSPQGEHIISAGWDLGITVWSMQTGREIATSSVHKAGVKSLGFRGASEELLSWARTEPVWYSSHPDAKSLRSIQMRRDGQGFRPSKVRFTPDGETILAIHPRQVSLIASSTRTFRITLFDFKGPILDAALSPGGDILATAEPGFVRLWNSQNGVLLQDLPPLTEGHDRFLLDFSPDGEYLLGVGSSLYVWKLANPVEVVHSLENQFSADYHTFIAPVPGTYQIFAGQLDGSMLKVDLGDGSSVSFGNPGLSINHLSLSPLQELLAYSTWEGDILVRKLDQPDPLLELSRTKKVQHKAILSGDGTLLAILSRDGKIEIIQVADGEQVLDFSIDGILVDGSFSPDGSLLLLRTRNGLQLWDLDPPLLRDAIPGYSARFSADGSLLAVARNEGVDQVIDLFDLNSQSLLNSFKAEGASMALSPDSSILALAGNTVTLWQIPEGTLLAELSLQGSYLNGRVLFTSQGEALVYTALDGTMRVWGIQ